MAQIDLKNALLLYIGESWPQAQGAEGMAWAAYDGQGALAASGDGAPPAPAAHGFKRRIAIAPSAVTLLIRLDAPAKNRTRFLQALPNAVEGALSCPSENIHTAPGSLSDDGKLPVAVVAFDWMQKTIAKLGTMGLRPDSMAPEILMAPLKPNAWSVVIGGGRQFARTGPWTGMELDAPTNGKPPVALAMLMEEARTAGSAPEVIHIYNADATHGCEVSDWTETLGVPVEKSGAWDWRHAIAGIDGFHVELLQGTFEPARPLAPARWIAAIALIIAFTALAHLGTAALELRSLRHDIIKQSTQLEKSFRQVFGAASMVDPVSSLGKRLDELRWRAGLTGAHGPDVMLAMAAEAISASARLKALDYSEGQLRLTLVMDGGKMTDDLASQISAAGLDCKVAKSELRDGGLEAELLIKEQSDPAGEIK